MERRSFLKGLGAIVGGLALAEAVPLGRVYSFPSVIHKPRWPLMTEWVGFAEYIVVGVNPALPGGTFTIFEKGDVISIAGLPKDIPFENLRTICLADAIVQLTPRVKAACIRVPLAS